MTYNIIDTIPNNKQPNVNKHVYQPPPVIENRCGGQILQMKIINGKESIILSPGYGRTSYAPKDDCTWILTASRGNVIRLTFDIFDLQTSTGCMADYLEVIDGPSDHHPRLARLCGYRRQKPLISRGNVVILKFSSNSFIEEEGFRIRASAECKLF